MRFDRVSRPQLARTFSEAFADYAVDTSYMTAERIRIRCVKNNVDFDLSVGAFAGERMVGFTLIGVDDWRGERTAFDAGTGIVPGYRGRSLVDHLPEGVSTVKLLNVESTDRGMIAFLERAGFRRRVDQYEMARPI